MGNVIYHAVVKYSERREREYAPPDYFKVDKDEAKRGIEAEAFKVLKTYGIPVPAYGIAKTAEISG